MGQNTLLTKHLLMFGGRVHVSAQVKLLKQMLLLSCSPLLFFFDLDSSEDRSNTCKETKKKGMTTRRGRVRLNAPVCVQQNILTVSRHKGAHMVEGGRVRAGCGDFHLERGNERVMGGAASSLSLPPVLTQAASQQEVFPRGFIFTCKTQQGVLCRDTTEANSALDTEL